MKKLFLVILLGLIILAPFTARAYACGGWFQSDCNSADAQQENEQNFVTTTINKLINAVPAPQLKDSLERKNISKRLTTFSDPAKVSYIYLVSYGRVMAFYTVKGKITSGSKRLTSTQRFIDPPGDGEYTLFNTESPELDGTYGTSNPYIYFWTTDGTYVQWSGEYMLADQPLKITTQPELVREIK